MKLQKTETTNRLYTLVQMKNARAAPILKVPVANSAQNTMMLAMKNRYESGMNRCRGTRAASAEKAGTAASMARNVPVNSQGSFWTPPATPISSRSGRKM